MKLNLALVFDTARRAHFVNPAHVVSIAATGGTIHHGEDKIGMPVIEIGLSNGQYISVGDIGATEEDAIENLIEQLQEDALAPNAIAVTNAAMRRARTTR